MFDPVRHHHEGWLPLLAGLGWIGLGLSGAGPWAWAAFLPGVFLAGSGAGILLWPGDRRLSHIAALGGALGVVWSLPALLAGPIALLLGALSAASALVAGYHAVQMEPPHEGVPQAPLGARLCAEVALDELVLGTMVFTQVFPSMDDHHRIRREIDAARERFSDAGWLDKPAGYHEAPPAPGAVHLRRRESRGRSFEHLSFPSEYEPRAGEPGRERWLGYALNAMAHAWVLRGDPARPWLVCLHGYRMGLPWIDLQAFRPDFFHGRLGLNLLVPTLPLHGLRKIGRRSGDGFLGGDLLDTIHAEAQSAWDLRRMLAWVRAQSGAPIGVYGLSLGGYNTALLASLDPDLACAIAGVPAADFARLFFHHAGPRHERAALAAGTHLDAMGEALRVVSPLALEPLVLRAGRAIFAGTADMLVPADQARDLWRHWQEPALEWYPGAHLTMWAHPRVRRLIEATLRGAGMIDAGASIPART